jgi:hypothetical protein
MAILSPVSSSTTDPPQKHWYAESASLEHVQRMHVPLATLWQSHEVETE